MSELRYTWTDPDNDEVVLDCGIDYSKHERATQWCPEEPEEWDLFEAKLNDKQVLHLLNSQTIDHILLSAQEYYNDKANEDFPEHEEYYKDEDSNPYYGD